MKSALRLLVRLAFTLIAIVYSGLAPAAYTLIHSTIPAPRKRRHLHRPTARSPGQDRVSHIIYDFADRTFSGFCHPDPQAFWRSQSGSIMRDLNGSLSRLQRHIWWIPPLPSVVGLIFDGSSYTLLSDGSGPEGRGINKFRHRHRLLRDRRGHDQDLGLRIRGRTRLLTWRSRVPSRSCRESIRPATWLAAQEGSAALMGSFPGSRLGAYGFVRSAPGSRDLLSRQ